MKILTPMQSNRCCIGTISDNGQHSAPRPDFAAGNQRLKTSTADTPPAKPIRDIDGIFDRVAIGRPGIVYGSVAIAHDLAVDRGCKVRQPPLKDCGSSRHKLVDRRKYILRPSPC